MSGRFAFCLALLIGALMSGEAVAQYGGGPGGGYYGGGGGYHHSERVPRHMRNREAPSGRQCYTKRSKVPDGSGGYRWVSQKVCE